MMQRLGVRKKSRFVNWNQNILGLHHSGSLISFHLFILWPEDLEGYPSFAEGPVYPEV